MGQATYSLPFGKNDNGRRGPSQGEADLATSHACGNIELLRALQGDELALANRVERIWLVAFCGQADILFGEPDFSAALQSPGLTTLETAHGVEDSAMICRGDNDVAAEQDFRKPDQFGNPDGQKSIDGIKKRLSRMQAIVFNINCGPNKPKALKLNLMAKQKAGH